MTNAQKLDETTEINRSWTGVWDIPAVLDGPITEDERAALTALSLSGIGPKGLIAAVAGDDGAAGALERLEGGIDRDAARRRLEKVAARVVVPGDQEFPALLRQIPAPPPLLFVRGAALSSLEPGVAVVGARVCTPGGARFATALGEGLASCGCTVVSGLARGIDGAAHEGALRAGTTIAVLGNGIDIVYPSEHRTLCAEIPEHGGAVITEFGPGVRPRAWHFRARNRLISGLSIATVVVEAGERSGALITTDFAIDQGRDVLACTVSPTTPSGAGVRNLLRSGAHLVLDVEHAIEQIAETAALYGYDIAAPAPRRRVPAELAGQAALVYEAVLEQTTVDELVERTGLPTAEVCAILTALDLEGAVSDDGGGRWRRTSAT